jgi:tripartite-type tricarboxylate transporter receptor subunit TctC
VTSPKRTPVAPDIPAIAEFLPGYATTGWQGILAPRGTPAPVVALLNKEIVSILKTPEVRERFLAMGAEPAGSSPAEFTAFIRSETAKWTKLLRDAGIKAE